MALPGCTRPRSGEQSPALTAAAADSVRGIVSVAGAEPMAVVQVTPGRGAGRPVAVAGPLAGLLRSLGGVDLVMRGSRATDGTSFEATSFTVRGVDGVAAVDGVIVRDGATVVLALTDGGRVAVPHLPPSLRSRVGARVYLAGPLDAAPAAYGVIAERPDD